MRKNLIACFAVTFSIIGLLLGASHNVNAWTCRDDYSCPGGDPGCSGGPDVCDPPSCGDACDTSCDTPGCDDDDPGGTQSCVGPCPTSVPQWNPYNVRVFFQYDGDNDGAIDPFGIDKSVSRPRPNPPGPYFYLFCNGRQRLNPGETPAQWLVHAENIEVGDPVIQIGALTSPTTAAYYFSGRHPQNPIWGGGVEMCDGGAYGHAITKIGGRPNQPIIIHVTLTDSALNNTRIGVVTISESRPGARNCSEYLQPVNGISPGLRDRFFYCDMPSIPDVYPATDGQTWVTDTIRVLISDRNPVPSCIGSWTDPAAPDPFDTVLGEAQRIGFNYITTVPLLPLSSYNVRFISDNPNIFDMDVVTAGMQDRITVPTQVGGPWLNTYGYALFPLVTTSRTYCNTTNTPESRITAQALNSSGAVMCEIKTPQFKVTCPEPEPWWQVMGGDFISLNGNISSDVLTDQPPIRQMITTDHWGMPIFTGSLLKPAAQINLGDPGWKVDSVTSVHKTAANLMYNYSYFWDKFHPTEADAEVPGAAFSNTTINTPNAGEMKEGYQVFHKAGPLTVNIVDLSIAPFNNTSQKVILFVDGDVNLNVVTKLEKGRDFFMIVSTGNIIVSPTVGDTPVTYTSSTPDLEGVFITDKVFKTGVSAEQLHVRGMVIGFGTDSGAYGSNVPGINNGIEFQRNLTVYNEFPAERFENAPDLLLLFPSFFAEKSISWKEVAP